MKRLLGTTIAALILAGASGATLAGNDKIKDQSVSPPTATTAPTDTTAADAYNHGQAVSQAAQAAQDSSLPPGQVVREAAHTQRDFKRFDADNNGTLSLAELTADTELTTNFSTLDTDSDGILSRAEFDGHLQLGAMDDDPEDE